MPGKSDETYVRYAKSSVKLLQRTTGADPNQRFLDVGSGPGRLLIGMLAKWGSVGCYCGLDVDARSISWAQQHLGQSGDVRFELLDGLSERYNPQGVKIDRTFRFPLEDASFDLATLFSVFSHMWLFEIEVYLSELRRVLASDGTVFATLFVEDDVPDEEENPKGYITEWSGPRHCIRLNRPAFEKMALEQGFKLASFEHRAMSSGQSVYVLTARDG
ncbi:MAG: class I SAM-dependent methyltransferase [Xanthomonadales bacterium]|nr:class I SAM-dependent methyltransferase [Xanthomonadales bacterium]